MKELIKNKNFYFYLSGFILVIYIFALISITNYKQNQIENYQKSEAQLYLEGKAVTLEYFFNILKNDITNFSENKDVYTYFLNEALGMSMQYGLKANMLKMQQALEEFEYNQYLGYTKILKNICVIDAKNKELASFNLHDDKNSYGLEFKDERSSYIYLHKNNEKIDVYVIKNIFYKNKNVGRVIALVNMKGVFNSLISNSNIILLTKEGVLNSNIKAKELIESDEYTNIIVNKTPFILSNKKERKDDFVSNLFIIGLSLLAIPILVAIYFLILLNNKNIRLNEEIKNSLKEKENEKIILQQSKVAAVGEMLGNISHQWRQPLSIMSTQATGLQLRLSYEEVDKEEIAKALENINAQTQYLSKTIDDFRNFFKGDTNEADFFNIKHTIENIRNLTKDSFKGNYISYECEIEELELKGNENLLIQALLNIFNNAKDALVENLRIDEERHFYIHTRKEENNLIIKIKDNAKGINDKILDKIFEPYFTTKHESIGTGIGLFMTNQIITKHFKGSIKVSNIELNINDKEYKGAQFTITIPIK